MFRITWAAVGSVTLFQRSLVPVESNKLDGNKARHQLVGKTMMSAPTRGYVSPRNTRRQHARSLGKRHVLGTHTNSYDLCFIFESRKFPCHDHHQIMTSGHCATNISYSNYYMYQNITQDMQ